MFHSNLILQNQRLLLRPTSEADLEGIYGIAHPEIWAHSATDIQSGKDARAYIQKAIDDRTAEIRQQLSIIDLHENRLIGCSSFENISTYDRRLEIGWTWLGREFQGKGFNRIAKYLMLEYSFDELSFERVEFRARATNLQSQKALENIGAKREATLRSYLFAEGQRHDFVYYSILRAEWEELKESVFKDLI